MATKTRPSPAKTSPAAKGSLRKPIPAPHSRTPAKPNTLITNFFKKSELAEPGLFFGTESKSKGNAGLAESQEDEEQWEESLYEEADRFHEMGLPVKRRRTGEYESTEDVKENVTPAEESTPPLPAELVTGQVDAKSATQVELKKRSGPFLDDDSDGEDDIPVSNLDQPVPSPGASITQMSPESTAIKVEDVAAEDPLPTLPKPPLLRQETSAFPDQGDFEDFADMPDLDEDDEDGEEYQYRILAAEQRKLEMSDGLFEGEGNEFDVGGDAVDVKQEPIKQETDTTTDRGSFTSSCPICDLNLDGIGASEASVHVNNCLDGNPSPLPDKKPISTGPKPTAFMTRKMAPKPGQQNPFILGQAPSRGGSAFSKLMSNHAEDLAWKTAAESEAAARGRPAYERTCPFYKILPGFSICVDAFRYGAVEGCKAYFLSHFHSDHYIGLTAKWCHGPIYCSRVTANLVRQQLGVDPKYVVDLNFEDPVDVPGTGGVKVTMIPANHCPGSSLYLFEKVIGKGKDPKIQRVLHCGDFRACRAHVEHPLLKPDVMDAVTGKTKEQKIDVCYLDTTYLNPKYAFPSQADVIQACADMCVSLSREFKDQDDNYEIMKRERAGSGMVQFLANGTQAVKQEETEPVDDRPAGQPRGRLLVVVGTYSIGKERICLGIARALKSKIYAPPGKQRIVRALEDPELSALMTNDPRAAQIHMTPLFEIRAETLDEYLKDYRDTFTRAIGFRPSGWNYRPPNSRFIESPPVATVLHGANWKSPYSMRDLVPQRGSTRRAACYGVPYSEHSSFRELTMFCCALRIDKVIPTVNVGSAKGRERMRGWVDRWAVERKKAGLFKAEDFGGAGGYVDP